MILKPMFFRATKSEIDPMSMKLTADILINNAGKAKLEVILPELAKVEMTHIVVPLKFKGRVSPYRISLADMLQENQVDTEVIDIDSFIAENGDN